MSAGSVAAARFAIQQAGGGSIPTSALQHNSHVQPRDLTVKPIDPKTARLICEKHHYLGSYPAGSLLNLGICANYALLGVAVIGVGPFNIHCLFQDAEPSQVACLSRLWVDNRCGRNSESRVLGIICRSLRRCQTRIKAIVAYSDPAAGHDGTIYRAAGFAYLGKSEAMRVYSFPNGSVYHSRTLSHKFGSHSMAHLQARGVDVQPVPQAPKFVYAAFIDPTWRDRLTRPILPYSEVVVVHESN